MYIYVFILSLRTKDVTGDLSIAEPPGGLMPGEVLAMGREIALD